MKTGNIIMVIKADIGPWVRLYDKPTQSLAVNMCGPGRPHKHDEITGSLDVLLHEDGHQHHIYSYRLITWKNTKKRSYVLLFTMLLLNCYISCLRMHCWLLCDNKTGLLAVLGLMLVQGTHPHSFWHAYRMHFILILLINSLSLSLSG